MITKVAIWTTNSNELQEARVERERRKRGRRMKQRRWAEEEVSKADVMTAFMIGDDCKDLNSDAFTDHGCRWSSVSLGLR